MSGPTTVLVSPGQILAVLLAASAIRAARAVHQAHADAAALRQAHDQERRTDSQRQAGAHEQGLAAMLAQADAAEQRLAQLAELSQRLGDEQALQAARPVRPQSNDYLSLADYVRAIEVFAADAQGVLMTALAECPAEGDEPGALASWLSAPASQPDVAASLAVRLLRRISHLGPPPADIQALAEELERTADGSRAQLLASELRRRIQLHAEKTLQDEVRRAQALVVEQSLQDLGYQVEEIEDTLFVEGGVAHFRKSHWGDYMVRMRVAQDGDSINFNVLRAVDADQVEGETSVQDHLAEDRWCAEFPVLLKTLAARGVRLEVTRRLEAGELPVQRVARDRLPRFAEEEAGISAAAPRLMERPLP
ncbi:MAG: hypothetical protein LBE81_11705 [Azonexus sp.]|jgi:hypothetical protein|uniref:hypothetical protein n=1 Tax=Azonexus sp. TaxID=1872668 RepID=UPI0028294433|nr:hypothetical protein [Azonexus sp.]MDR0777284.1 hypothetical protein [Azonexus sp.]